MASDKPSRTLQPLHIALLAIALAGLLFLWFWPTNKPAEELEPIPLADEPVAAAPEAEAVVEPAPPQADIPEVPAPEKVATPEPLPSLNDSDAALSASLQTSVGEQQWQSLAPLLASDYLIRKAVRAVVAAAGGDWVNQHRPLNAPATPFVVEKNGDELRMSTKNFARYTPYVDALVAIDAATAAQLYSQYYPLLQEAYGELGLKQGNFHGAVVQALTLLESTPAYREALLVQPSVAYKYQDPQIERLPEIQKLLLRMGPENQQRLQAWLQNLEQQLAAQPKQSAN